MFLPREHSSHCYRGCDQSVPLGDVRADHQPGCERPAGGRRGHALRGSVHHEPRMGGLRCKSAACSTFNRVST